MNGDRFFLDTNIFIYYWRCDDLRKMELSTALIARAGDSELGAISTQVMQEFFAVALRKFRSAMSLAESEQFLWGALQPLLAVTASAELVRSGLQIEHRFRLSWYDALIVAAAQAAKCRLLYSEDFQHGADFDGVRVINPYL